MVAVAVAILFLQRMENPHAPIVTVYANSKNVPKSSHSYSFHNDEIAKLTSILIS